LTLEVADILLEAFSKFYFDGKKVIVVPPEFSPGSVLVVESLLHLSKVSERLAWKRIELVIGGAFEIAWEHMAQERVFMR